MTSKAMTTTTENTAIANVGAANAWTSYSKNVGVSSGLYGRHNGNVGKYLMGTEEPETFTAPFDIENIRIGWLGFDENNKPHNGPEVTIKSQKELPDHPEIDGVRWIKQAKVGVYYEAEDGTVDMVILACKADLPTRAINKLIQAYGAKRGMNLDLEADGAGSVAMTPVVTATSREFDATIKETQADGKVRTMKTKKYAEQYEITSWLSSEDLAAAIAKKVPAVMTVVDHVPEGTVQEVLPPEKPAQATTGATAAPAAGRGRFGGRSA